MRPDGTAAVFVWQAGIQSRKKPTAANDKRPIGIDPVSGWCTYCNFWANSCLEDSTSEQNSNDLRLGLNSHDLCASLIARSAYTTGLKIGASPRRGLNETFAITLFPS